MAREVVRTLQEGRKSAGLDVSDRIEVWWESDDDDLQAAMAVHGEAIAAEVLALATTRGAGPQGSSAVATELPITLALAKATRP